MSIAFAVDIRRVTIPVGVRETIHFVGNVLSVLSAQIGADVDPDFRLGINDDSPARFRKALRFRMPEGEQFEKVTVENPTGAAGPLTIEILLANGDVSDERLNVVAETLEVQISNVAALETAVNGLNVSVASLPANVSGAVASAMATLENAVLSGNTLVDVADITVGTGAVLLSAADAARRSVTVQNVGALNVRVGSSAVTMTRGLLLRPDGSVTLDTSAAVYAISSAAGATVAVSTIREV